MMRSTLRQLRHGPLKRYHRVWTLLGKCYHQLIQFIPFIPTAQQKIGRYGPFRFHPRFAFSAFHQWGDHHNAGFTDCVESCRGKQCVLDIGAHIGLVSMPISQAIGPRGVIHAFEPAKANRSYLNYHLKKNHIKNVTVSPLLVGSTNQDDVSFYELDGDTGMNSVVLTKKQANFTLSKKQQTTLDTYCESHSLQPDVIKIDVEGYELDVLRGAQKTLQRFHPFIYLSVHPTHLEKLGHRLIELTDFIESIGFKLTELDGSPIQVFKLSEYLMQPNPKELL